jgi:hypothetical protein
MKSTILIKLLGIFVFVGFNDIQADWSMTNRNKQQAGSLRK